MLATWQLVRELHEEPALFLRKLRRTLTATTAVDQRYGGGGFEPIFVEQHILGALHLPPDCAGGSGDNAAPSVQTADDDGLAKHQLTMLRQIVENPCNATWASH